LLEYALIRDRQHVLDIATGTGHIAIAASQIVGSEGRVIGIDISAGMLEQTRNKVEALGLKNIEFQLADAELLNFPTNSFHPSGSEVAHGGNEHDRAGSPNSVRELLTLDRGQRSCITTLASISQTWRGNCHSYTSGHS
jgi:SAM-dependent methyltransferase